jgi:hypothetical protein
MQGERVTTLVMNINLEELIIKTNFINYSKKYIFIIFL